MNKNTKRRMFANRKAVKTGNKTVISQNKARNMEMVITGGRTQHRPINPDLPFKPYKPKFSKSTNSSNDEN
jgi:hypothetical protein